MDYIGTAFRNSKIGAGTRWFSKLQSSLMQGQLLETPYTGMKYP